MAEEREDVPRPESSNEQRSLGVTTVIEKNETIVKEARERDKVSEVEGDGGDDSTGNIKTEVILLDEAPAGEIARSAVKTCENRRVIELSDAISKMELRRQLKAVVDSPRNVGESDDGGAVIISRLPPGTILIKRSSASDAATSRACRREDSDYVRESSKDSTETNSSGGSSVTSYTVGGRLKRMQHRAVRSKKIAQVRRNPVRNKKKKPVDEEFPRVRQRLLSVKRKAGLVVDPVSRKRAKTAPAPYMNTRSVTRKMYTVGATYQAPTIHDAIEWKEWPAHGMHERPVWHPQFGLAFGYNERHFLSLDDRTYREIVDEPAIEVVSVDPNPEGALLAGSQQKLETPRSCDSSDYLDTSDVKPSTSISREGSFEACMHASLHSVLAYCARVVAPTYKSSVEKKFEKTSQASGISDNGERSGSEHLPDFRKITETSRRPVASCSSTRVPRCLVVPRTTTTSLTNARNIHRDIFQEVFARASNNTLIFFKPTTDPSSKSEEKKQPNAECATEETNLARLDDAAMTDEPFVEISCVYKKTTANEEVGTTVKPPVDHGYQARAPTKSIVAANASKQSPSVSAKPREGFNGDCTSDSNQAAKIAKILAEYNEKAAKHSESESAWCSAGNSSTNANSGKLERVRNRASFFSVAEQPKKVKREEKVGERRLAEQPSGADVSTTKILSIKTEAAGKSVDDSRAIDLSTAKSRQIEAARRQRKIKPEESTSHQRLQELIEDTALLYCAAAGVAQDDVVDYLDTLDSTQSMEWLGS